MAPGPIISLTGPAYGRLVNLKMFEICLLLSHINKKQQIYTYDNFFSIIFGISILDYPMYIYIIYLLLLLFVYSY